MNITESLNLFTDVFTVMTKDKFLFFNTPQTSVIPTMLDLSPTRECGFQVYYKTPIDEGTLNRCHNSIRMKLMCGKYREMLTLVKSNKSPIPEDEEFTESITGFKY